MKTTVVLPDELLSRAKRFARRSGRPLRALIEDGLRMVLEQERMQSTYEMPDCSVGDPDADNPLHELTWEELRSEIYGGR